MFLSERLAQKARKPYQASNAVEFFFDVSYKTRELRTWNKKSG